MGSSEDWALTSAKRTTFSSRAALCRFHVGCNDATHGHMVCFAYSAYRGGKGRKENAIISSSTVNLKSKEREDIPYQNNWFTKMDFREVEEVVEQLVAFSGSLGTFLHFSEHSRD